MRSVVAALIAGLPLLVTAQSHEVGGAKEFVGGHLDHPPVLDGKVEPQEYEGAIHLDGLVDSETGAVANEGGTFYLGYDAHFVYFAAKLKDQRPDAIQATEFRQGVGLDGDDSVTLALDPYANLADFSYFGMNARGATNLQIAGGRAAKREWLGEFVAKGRVTTEGWEVEARIPWSVMRLPGRGAHDLRFNIFRNFRRLNRGFSWVMTNNGLQANTARWKAVDLPGAEPPRLLALPYLYGGLDAKSGLVANAGADLRYPITRDLDLVGTINPDFRNVELGVLSLDFSYFQRLAGETRPFFLEGGDYLSGFGDAPIFVPQSIGHFDVGAKAFGKLNPSTDMGVLTTDQIGGDEAIVARVHRQVSARRDWALQYAGGEVDGTRSDAVAGRYGFGLGDWNMGAQLSATHTQGENDGHRAVLNGFYGRQRTYSFVRYAEISPTFDPRLGFAPERGYRGFDAWGSHTWTAPKKGLLDYGVDLNGIYYRNYGLDGPYHEGGSIAPGVTFNDGLHFTVAVGWDRYFGGTGDQTYGIYTERPLGNPYRHWYLTYETGTRAGSRYENARAGASYRPLPRLQLDGSLQSTLADGVNQDQAILSANHDLDLYHSIGGRFVVGPHISNFYLSFRQAGNRGAEYYLILGDPNADHLRASVVLKAVFPLSTKL